MKRHTSLILTLLSLLASCTYPRPAPTAEATQTLITLPPTLTATLPRSTPTATVTVTAVVPTDTPVPCDPFAADFCITDGSFIFQKPIQPPGNDSVDISYRYGTSAKRTRDPHHGVEFLNKFGTPVHAAGDGEVVFAGLDEVAVYSPWPIFYGNVVVIRHGDELYTLYAHLSRVEVYVGQQVRAGQKIGEVGQTGAAIGSHLHFEVRRGGDGMNYFSTENPEYWLIPKEGTGTISIQLVTARSTKFERDIVITSQNNVPYYVFTYAKGFEHNLEDVVVGDLPAGMYRIAFADSGTFFERWVEVQSGKLTEVIFEIGQ
jgi:murein DD-endopeptidase MepM/ murein hydrolase activator NlpD